MSTTTEQIRAAIDKHPDPVTRDVLMSVIQVLKISFDAHKHTTTTETTSAPSPTFPG